MQWRQLRVLPRCFVELFIVLEIILEIILDVLELGIIRCRLRRIILVLWIRSRLRQDYLQKPRIIWCRLRLELGILFFHRLLRRLRSPAVKQRQCPGIVLAGASRDLTGQSAFCEIAAADAVRKLLQMLGDLLDVPATAEIVADHRMKAVAAVAASRSAFTHDPLDIFDVVTWSATSEAVAVELCLGCRFCRLGLAALSPDNAPTKSTVDISQLFNRTKSQARDGQGLRCTAK